MPYEYPTNYSNGTVVTGPGGLFVDWPVAIISNYANAFLILIFLAIFTIGSFSGILKSIVASLFITSVLSVYFSAQGWVNMAVPFGLISVLIILIIIALFEGKNGSSL